ncbi:MAG: hypothetical protein ABI772_00790 [Bacteroidota bacterium]
MKTLIYTLAIFLIAGCHITLITGYDPVIDETTTNMKKDFNLHFIKLMRTLQDEDSTNQSFEKFQDYYDNMEVNLIALSDRAKFLDTKSTIVKKQVILLDSTMHVFMNMHRNGLRDSRIDDRRDIKNAINSSFDAVIMLQEELKSSGTIKNN